MLGRTRLAVRIVLLDAASRVLLFEGRDISDTGDSMRFWFTAGGGVDDGESLLDAAHRELQEETGQSDLRLVGPFHRRVSTSITTANRNIRWKSSLSRGPTRPR